MQLAISCGGLTDQPTATGIDGALVSATPTVGTSLVTTNKYSHHQLLDTGLSSGIAPYYAIIPYGYNGNNALTCNYRTRGDHTNGGCNNRGR